MKIFSSSSSGFGFNRCRAAVGVSLVLLATLASHSWAAPLSPSPVGNWDCISSGGGQNGITFLKFTTNTADVPGTYTLSGEELFASTYKSPAPFLVGRGSSGGRGGVETNTVASGTTNNFIVHGFFPVDGVWGYDVKGNIIGYLYFVGYVVGTGEPKTNAVSFNGKVSGKAPNQRLSLVSSTSFGKVTYTGMTMIPVTNASGYFNGPWYGIKKQNNQFFQEFFTLSNDDPDFPNTYTISGGGPAYTSAGTCMISRQNKIAFDVSETTSGTNSLFRSSIGSFNKRNESANTSGSIYPYGAGNNIQFNAVRYPE